MFLKSEEHKLKLNKYIIEISPKVRNMHLKSTPLLPKGSINSISVCKLTYVTFKSSGFVPNFKL